MNPDSQRFFSSPHFTIDLSQVAAIKVGPWSHMPNQGIAGYRYDVVFKNGTKLEFIGEGLHGQFKEYNGISRESNS